MKISLKICCNVAVNLRSRSEPQDFADMLQIVADFEPCVVIKELLMKQNDVWCRTEQIIGPDFIFYRLYITYYLSHPVILIRKLIRSAKTSGSIWNFDPENFRKLCILIRKKIILRSYIEKWSGDSNYWSGTRFHWSGQKNVGLPDYWGRTLYRNFLHVSDTTSIRDWPILIRIRGQVGSETVSWLFFLSN